MSGERLALFDFDGTLCAGNSLHLFMRAQALRPASAARVLWWVAARKLLRVATRRYKEGVLGTLRGLAAGELAALGAQTYGRRIRPLVRREGLAELERCRREGMRIVLVTGAFDFLIEPFRAEHAIGDCLCCRVEVGPLGCTGRIVGPEMLGEEKALAVSQRFAASDVDWAGSVAYSDDWRDLPFLMLAGRGFLVGEAKAGRPNPVPPAITQVDWR